MNPRIVVSNTGHIKVEGTGHAKVKEFTFTIQNVSTDPANFAQKFHAIDGVYTKCTPASCPGLTGVVTDSDGFLTLTQGSFTRHVWHNENGYKIATNGDGVMNIFDNLDDVVPWNSRLGFITSSGALFCTVNTVNVRANTAVIEYDNGLDIFENV